MTRQFPFKMDAAIEQKLKAIMAEKQLSSLADAVRLAIRSYPLNNEIQQLKEAIP